MKKGGRRVEMYVDFNADYLSQRHTILSQNIVLPLKDLWFKSQPSAQCCLLEGSFPLFCCRPVFSSSAICNGNRGVLGCILTPKFSPNGNYELLTTILSPELGTTFWTFVKMHILQFTLRWRGLGFTYFLWSLSFTLRLLDCFLSIPNAH